MGSRKLKETCARGNGGRSRSPLGCHARLSSSPQTKPDKADALGWTIEWSDSWGFVLQAQMEGRRCADFIILDINGKVIDPFVSPPDKNRFPLRFIPKVGGIRRQDARYPSQDRADSEDYFSDSGTEEAPGPAHQRPLCPPDADSEWIQAQTPGGTRYEYCLESPDRQDKLESHLFAVHGKSFSSQTAGPFGLTLPFECSIWM